MIFQHCRSWMPSQMRRDSSRIAAAFDGADPHPSTSGRGHQMGTTATAGRKTPAISRGKSGGGGNRTRPDLLTQMEMATASPVQVRSRARPQSVLGVAGHRPLTSVTGVRVPLGPLGFSGIDP